MNKDVCNLLWCIILVSENNVFVEILWLKIRKYILKVFNDFMVIGVNLYLWFLKYLFGYYFKSYYDGIYEDNDKILYIIV